MFGGSWKSELPRDSPKTWRSVWRSGPKSLQFVLVKNYRKRMISVIANKGFCTKYLCLLFWCLKYLCHAIKCKLITLNYTMWFSGFFVLDSVTHSWRVPMIKMTDFYMLCKWKNLQNRQCIKCLFSSNSSIK